MIDWITGIAAKADGWTVVVVLLIGAVARELVPAWLKWKGANLEERKYTDGETKEGYQALITDLKEQVKELKANVATVLSELKEVRAAHITCEVGQAELRGEMNVMKEQMAAIHRHEKANSDNTLKLAKIVEEETGKAPKIT